MSGRWVDTMKKTTVWRSKYTARGYKGPQIDEGCFATTATIQGNKRDQGHKTFVVDYTQAFLNAEVRQRE